MASFKAINIESDDESDDEVDNTKEIQVEDALKVYQTALRLHSQPETLQEAGKEYETLFESEIFKLPEALSEFNRIAALGSLVEDEDVFFEVLEDPDVAAQLQVDAGPGTLPQLLHLSYKNRGEYYLDLLRSIGQQRDDSVGDDLAEWRNKIKGSAKLAIQDFGEALDKDEDDLDLWRRCARVASVLGSRRIARFCLETAISNDLEGTEGIFAQPNPETRLNYHQLKNLESDLADDLAIAQDPKTQSEWQEPTQAIKRRLALYPFLPLTPPASPRNDGQQPQREILELPSRTWDSLVQCLLKRFEDEQSGARSIEPGSAVGFQLSENASQRKESATEESNVLESPQEEKSPTKSPVKVDFAGLDNAVDENGEKPEILKQGLKVTSQAKKRLSEAADIGEGGDGERQRSKRIRARESIGQKRGIDESTREEGFTGSGETPKLIQKADQWLWSVTDPIARKIGATNLAQPQDLRKILSNEAAGDAEEIKSEIALRDLYRAMQTWTEKKTSILMTNPSKNLDSDESQNPGLSIFLEQTGTVSRKASDSPIDTLLTEFVDQVNSSWLDIVETTVLLLISMLCDRDSSRNPELPTYSLYEQENWSEDLKQNFTKLMLTVDMNITGTVTKILQDIFKVSNRDENNLLHPLSKIGSLCQLTQALMELHLDVYTHLSGPGGDMESELVTMQRQRLLAWWSLSRDAVCMTAEASAIEDALLQQLVTRHLWTSVFALKSLDDVSREHLILCVEDLRQSTVLPVLLPNLSILPELSQSAADREISKLQTVDFFMSIFVEQHPVDLIEKLEPILMSNMDAVSVDGDSSTGMDVLSHVANADGAGNDVGNETPRTRISSVSTDSSRKVLIDFIGKTSLSLRLTLWNRLRQAYEDIQYLPMAFVIDCHVLQLVMRELTSQSYAEETDDERQSTLLTGLRLLNEVLEKSFEILDSETDRAFECVDLSLLQATASATAELWNILYAMSFFDDYSMMTQKSPPLPNPFRAYPIESFHKASTILHSMQVHTSILLYKIIVEAMTQLPEQFPAWAADRVDYLRYVHYSLGMRRLCKAADNKFLHFMRKECEALRYQNTTDDIAQIVYDLYDLNCFSNPSQKQDHGCDADYLDPKTATELVDFVFEKAKQVITKDLLKSDLGRTIEKVHTALPPYKQRSATLRNGKIIAKFLEAPLHPLELFRSLDGTSFVSTGPVHEEDAPLAAKGWFFLMGQISLAKQRTQRSKGNPGSLDDLQTAVEFFTHDLEYSTEHWETWYRLAHAQDYAVEEQVLWSAEKLNSQAIELLQAQRASIHAYGMACATAVRCTETSEDIAMKQAEMYYEFAARIYSASRPPFSMYAFTLQGVPEKYFSGPSAAGGIYRQAGFSDLHKVQAWRYAASLILRALNLRSTHWQSHYVFGKCLWKLRQASELTDLTSCNRVLDAFFKAVATSPSRKDSAKQEPVLEPIYKTVSVIHKLVKKGHLSPEQAVSRITNLLESQKQFEVTKMPSYDDTTGWDAYVVDVITVIRTADKARWHHRIVYRAARIMYEADNNSDAAAKKAKEWLVDQHMYSTKTMALQVWKPDTERAGRHWVYMTEYCRFLCRLLAQTDDLEGMQTMARRVRKKQNEFYEHQALWESVCNSHLVLHRRHGNIPLDLGDAIFKAMTSEEFASVSSRIEKWCADPDNNNSLLNVLRETAELKKINSSLIRSSTFDDLLADTYAMIFREIGPMLQPLSDGPRDDIGRQAPASSKPSEPERVNVMALNNLMNLDGALDRQDRAATPASTSGGVGEAPVRAPKIKLVTKRELVKHATEAAQAKICAASAQYKAHPKLDNTGFKVVVPVRNGETPQALENGQQNENDDNDRADEEARAASKGAAPESSDLSDPEPELGETIRIAHSPSSVLHRLTAAASKDNVDSADDSSQRADDEDGADDRDGDEDEAVDGDAGSLNHENDEPEASDVASAAVIADANSDLKG